TEDPTLLTASATGARRRGDDAVGQARERQRLQDDATWPRELRKEQSLAAEERGLDAGHHLNVVVHRLFQSDETAGVHAQRFSLRQLRLGQCARRVQKRETVASEPLEDETLASEESGADSPVEGDADVDTERRAEK